MRVPADPVSATGTGVPGIYLERDEEGNYGA